MLHWSNGACRTNTCGVGRGWLVREDGSVSGVFRDFRDVQSRVPSKITKQFSKRERERAPIPACPWRSVPLKVRPKVFLSAQLLCEGNAALTLPEMTKPKGLSCAADPCGGLFINFIQCLCEHEVCIIILHHYFWFRELAELVSSDQVPVSFWGSDDTAAEFSAVCVL